MELEAQSDSQAIASNVERKAEKRDGELSDDEEVEDEFEEERGLVDGKIRRDDEYDEEYEGIQIDESQSLWNGVVYLSVLTAVHVLNSSDSYLAQTDNHYVAWD